MNRFLKTLGPGILFASTAIGVSHLVQSTRAGADFGFALLWAIIAANVLKFPFFEYGSRYANATGESLIDGYSKLGRWMLWLYFLITLFSMFFVTAAIGAVTSGFLDNLFSLSALFPNFKLFAPTLLFVVCLLILVVGRFKLLDGLIKIIGVTLVFTTLVAFTLTLMHGPAKQADSFVVSEVFTAGGIAFVIALMGWMPTAVDLSAWNSLWTLERFKTSGYRPSLKETLIEFNLGYWISAALSICFVTLGAYLIFGTGTTMPEGSVAFSQRVISLYTETIGNWSYIIIAAAAFSIMFGTALGVFDGYARAMERTIELLFFSKREATQMLNDRKVYLITLFIVATGAYAIIAWFGNQLKPLVDLATTISFLIAPVIAVVNFRLVSHKSFPAEARPGSFMSALSYVGILFLTGFSLLYLWLLIVDIG
jgi:Mn2+/Fe2+ NRAMP family transporter